MRVMLSATSVLLLAAVLVMGQTREPDAVRQVWERMIEAKGGRDRLLEVDSLLMVWPRRGDPDRLWYHDLYVFPNRSWRWADHRPDDVFGLHLDVWDGNGRWITDGWPSDNYRIRTVWTTPHGAEQHALIRAQTVYLLESRWLRPELLGLETGRIGFRRYDVITANVGGNRLQYYVDRETSLVRRVQVPEGSESDIFDIFRDGAVWDLEDYVSVDGIMMPSRVEWDQSGTKNTYHWEYSFNVDYDPEAFSRRPALEDGPEGWKRPEGRETPAPPPPAAPCCIASPTAPASSPDREVTAGTGVVVDVAVTDASGLPVTTLSQDDFQVYEDGEVRELASFALLETPHHVVVVEDCSGSADEFLFSNYYLETLDLGDDKPLDRIPFQMAMVRLLQGLTNPYRVALAEFGEELRLLRNLGEVPAAVGGTIRFRNPQEAFGPDCIETAEGPHGRFEEKLAWISERLERIPGRKSVVWFGPPKNLPGVFRSVDRLQFGNRDGPAQETPFEQTPEALGIVDAIGRTDAAFFFVLSQHEFGGNYSDDQERKRRRYIALARWAETSGGRVALLYYESDMDALIDELNREPGTSYRLTYLSSPNPTAPATRVIEVRVDDPALRVLQSPTRYRED